MKLTQQTFASLLGVTLASVNRWENGLAIPTKLSALLLKLLANALAVRPPQVVIETLRSVEPEPLAIVRTLVRLAEKSLPTEVKPAPASRAAPPRRRR
jgi:transcriptional regulator with XRE-family HTH domain